MPMSGSEKSLVTDAYSVQLGNSDIVLQDELGNSNLLDVEEFSCTNREVVNLENAAVNIDNSNDVIIGPVTQFNVSGNVTIYQNGTAHEAIVDKTVIQEQEATLNFTNDGSINEKDLQKKKHLCYEIIYINKYGIRNIGLVFIILVASLSIALILINQRRHVEEEEEDYNYDYQETHYGDHLGDHKVYYREDWEGKPPKNNTKPLEDPATLLIISHSSTFPCNSFNNCASEVQRMQQKHFSRPFSSVDIGYNFVIGGDGDIYVGRGWDIQNFHRRNSIGINIIGNFAYDTFNDSMIEATELLIDQGLEMDKLSEDYILVGENQTNSKYYTSPGVNVYKVIKTWPHFSDKTIL